MPPASIFFAGQPHEVAHHAAPFRDQLDVKVADADVVLQQAQPGDLVIFYSEHFERFRECCQQLKSRNVATIYMIDGILEWRNAWENKPDEIASPYAMRPALSHKVACIGHSQARILDGWGNVGKTEIVGIPRFDDFCEPTGPAARDTNSRNGSDAFRILVMTAKTPAFTPQQHQTTARSLNDLKNWHAQKKTINGRRVEFVWRLTKGLEEQIEVENHLTDLSGTELKEILDSVDAVITTPSTAMLEAMLMGLPVAVLDYHNRPRYVSSGWDIYSAEHIDLVIQQMLNRDEARMVFQHNSLRDSLNCSTNATERFVELATSMLRIAQQKISAGQPLEFPARLLADPPIQLAEFSHQRLYTNADEFSLDDKIELQVQLSHTRREISNLKTELEETRAILSEAHEVFEQIEQHPIAGPIVRIRKLLADWISVFGKQDHAG